MLKTLQQFLLREVYLEITLPVREDHTRRLVRGGRLSMHPHLVRRTLWTKLYQHDASSTHHSTAVELLTAAHQLTIAAY